MTGRRIDEAQQQPADGRLTATRLPDEADGLSLANIEADTVDRVHVPDMRREDPSADREELAEVPCGKHHRDGACVRTVRSHANYLLGGHWSLV